MAGLADILGRVQGAGSPMPQGPPGMMGGMGEEELPLPREVMIQLIMFLLQQMEQGGQPPISPEAGGMPPGMGPEMMPPPGM